jgi:zinc transport system permease protein
MAIGVTVCIVGLTFTYFQDYSPGATIVVLAIVLYAAVALARPLFARRPWRDPHPDVADDVELARERSGSAPEHQEAKP